MAETFWPQIDRIVIQIAKGLTHRLYRDVTYMRWETVEVAITEDTINEALHFKKDILKHCTLRCRACERYTGKDDHEDETEQMDADTIILPALILEKAGTTSTQELEKIDIPIADPTPVEEGPQQHTKDALKEQDQLHRPIIIVMGESHHGNNHIWRLHHKKRRRGNPAGTSHIRKSPVLKRVGKASSSKIEPDKMMGILLSASKANPGRRSPAPNHT